MAGPISSHVTSDLKLARKQRRVHHKVRTGCSACKVRRHKCDEQRPICSGCRRHSTECTYQTTRPSPPPLPPPPQPISALPGPHPLADINFADLELMHHWLTSTCIATGQRPEITTHVQRTILPLAQTHPFVMRGVLAMAATHLAGLRPDQHAHYTVLATRNHQHGLADFRAAVQHIHERNFAAVISYSKSLLWCSFAANPSCKRTHALEHETTTNWLPEWFRLLRGSCHVVEYSRPWIREGPHLLADLEEADVDAFYAEARHADTRHLTRLLVGMRARMERHPVCEVVFGALRTAFARAAVRRHNTPLRNAINYWVAAVPEEYFEALKGKEDWALIALAYACVLVHRLEETGFRKGHARGLIRTIGGDLEGEARGWVHWPWEEVGLDS